MAYRTALTRGLGWTLVIASLVIACLVTDCLALAAPASAATQYVSDQLSINMRSGPGTQYKIKKLLNAGDKLETLSQSKGWTKVRVPGGDTGFVLTRLVSNQPSTRKQFADLKQRADVLQSNNADLKTQLSQARDGSDKLGKRKRDLVALNKSLEQQLQKIRETAADAIRIGKENERYRKQLLSLRSDVDRLKHENDALQSRRGGMKIGALILFGGIVLGFVLPMFRRRRKSSWDSL